MFRGEQNRILEQLRGEQALRREAEALRDRTALDRLQRQFQELYGPLHRFIQYGDSVNEIERQRIPQGARSDDAGLVQRYFVEQYYLPLNTQIAELICTKVHLLESDEVPASFTQFLVHAEQYECLHGLWKETGIGRMTSYPFGTPRHSGRTWQRPSIDSGDATANRSDGCKRLRISVLRWEPEVGDYRETAVRAMMRATAPRTRMRWHRGGAGS